MDRIRTNIPACISGAADWVLNLSASAQPQQAATVPIPITMRIATSEAARARASAAPSAKPTTSSTRRRDQRPQAGREHEAGEQHRARGGGGEQAVEPALLDVAGEVDAGGGAGEARRPAAG